MILDADAISLRLLGKPRASGDDPMKDILEPSGRR